MIINFIVIITINDRLFTTHTHACEFVTSKTSWHTKIWHAMTNIGTINSRTQKFMVSQKIMDYHENL